MDHLSNIDKLILVGPTFAFIVNAAINIWGNLIQRRQAIALEEPDRSATPREGKAVAANSAPVRPILDRRSIGIMGLLMIMSWAAVGYDIYDRHHNEWWSRPHEQTVNWQDFFPSWSLDLEGRLLGITKPCVLKISAVQEHMELRKILVQIVTENSACTIADDAADQIPSEMRDVDAMPIPPPGLSIHWNKDTQPHGESIAGWFYGIGFIVTRGHTLPPDSKATEIWIDIGPGFLWQHP